MQDLKALKCEVCQVGAALATEQEIIEFKSNLPQWNIIEEASVKKLERKFKFKDFNQTLDFVNKVGTIAEENGHHPRMLVEYNQVVVWWWTHKIKGLHRNDFIMAAKTDGLII